MSITIFTSYFNLQAFFFYLFNKPNQVQQLICTLVLLPDTTLNIRRNHFTLTFLSKATKLLIPKMFCHQQFLHFAISVPTLAAQNGLCLKCTPTQAMNKIIIAQVGIILKKGKKIRQTRYTIVVSKYVRYLCEIFIFMYFVYNYIKNNYDYIGLLMIIKLDSIRLYIDKMK